MKLSNLKIPALVVLVVIALLLPAFVSDYWQYVFTVALFYLTDGRRNAGILRDETKVGCCGYYRYSLVAAGLNLEFHTHNATSRSYETVSLFRVDDFFVANQWRFVGITYDSVRRELRFFDETGREIPDSRRR